MTEEQHSVLVVDDEEQIRDLLSMGLEGSGYEVLVAKDGVEALEILKDLQPSLIISDIIMPRMGGFAFLKKLQEDKTREHIPFIFLSSKSETQYKLAGLRLGVDDFISKPFAMNELIIRVNNLIEKKATAREAKAKHEGDFSGDLSNFNVFDLVQLFTLGSKSGLMILDLPKETGRIYFQNGLIIDAEYNDFEPEPGVIELLTSQEGSFTIKFTEVDRERKIDSKNEGLMLRALKFIDERAAGITPIDEDEEEEPAKPTLEEVAEEGGWFDGSLPDESPGTATEPEEAEERAEEEDDAGAEEEVDGEKKESDDPFAADAAGEKAGAEIIRKRPNVRMNVVLGGFMVLCIAMALMYMFVWRTPSERAPNPKPPVAKQPTNIPVQSDARLTQIFSKIETHITAGKLSEAVAQIETVKLIAPDNPKLQELEAKIEKIRKDMAAAAARKARLERSKKALGIARSYLKKGNYSKAISSAKAVLKDDPGNKTAKSIITKSERFQKEKRRRKEKLDKHIADANRLYNSGDFEGALSGATAALKMEKKNAEAQRIEEKAKRAIRLMREKQDQFNEAKQLVQRGKKFFREKEYESAFEEFGKAIQVFPDYPEAQKYYDDTLVILNTPRFGSLHINVLPFGDVLIDGRNYGPPPIHIDRIIIGKHKIVAVRDGYASVSTEVKVKEGEETRVDINLDKK